MRLDSVRSGVGLGATNTVLDRAEDAHIHFADRQKTQAFCTVVEVSNSRLPYHLSVILARPKPEGKKVVRIRVASGFSGTVKSMSSITSMLPSGIMMFARLCCFQQKPCMRVA